MKVAAIVVFVCAINFVAVQAQKAPRQTPDTIYVNGSIYLGATEAAPGAVQSAGRAQALAVRGDHIVAVGTNTEIKKLKSKNTQLIDLGGHFVMPGFNDAHLHLSNGGFEKLNINLAGTKSLAEMKSRIAARATSAARDEWLMGRGWDHTLWPGQKLPTRQELDEVTAEHPAFLTRVDGHIAIANSAALKAASIGAQTPDPFGGKIDKDTNGQPTGILRESAKELVSSKIPRPTPTQRRRAIELALQDAAQWGVTSAQDNSDWEDFLIYEDLEREGKLTLRIAEWLPFAAPVKLLEEHRAHHPQTDPMLHTTMLKGFMDGSLGSRTAALLQPYSDDPKNSGLPQYEPGKLNEMTAERALAGFQIGFHAIGDRGVEMALQAFAEAVRQSKERQPEKARDFRFRVEHVQVAAPMHFQRFRDLRVIASMQPNHLLTDMNWAFSRIGAERAKYSYAWAEFLKNGVILAFGTDYPVEPITPLRGLYAAVTRKNEARTAEYVPQQKLTVEQAIAAYTTGAAYAEFAEAEKGTLAPGKLADFVVLDRDVTRIAPAEILGTKVLRTVVGGKTVYGSR